MHRFRPRRRLRKRGDPQPVAWRIRLAKQKIYANKSLAPGVAEFSTN
jgi:hypothetical protein